METKKKKKISFPSAITVLFIVLLFAAALTFVVPAGLYTKLLYNPASEMFEVTDPDGNMTEMPATQETLDKLKVTGDGEVSGRQYQQADRCAGHLPESRTEAAGIYGDTARTDQRSV